MKKIVFENGWQLFFASHQLCGFDDFFDFDHGRMINKNSKRNVVEFEFSEKGQSRTFFMKRFIQPHLKDMLSAFCHAGKFCSQAEVEWRNAKILLGNGIETYHPVCYGLQSRFGMEQQSFFITEQIKGVCLTDYLKQSWRHTNDEDKQALAIKLGLFFQQIHAMGIRLPDSYIWHVYRVISNTAVGGFELGMIDLHRMQTRKSDLRSAAKDLGAFLFSLPDGFMDAALRSLFMDSYLDHDRIRNRNAFREKVKRWELKISNRRKRELAQLQ